jgi:hypothetical protein
VSEVHWANELHEAASRRVLAEEEEFSALEHLYWTIRQARHAGMSVIEISKLIGTTRQRVYEILRES